MDFNRSLAFYNSPALVSHDPVILHELNQGRDGTAAGLQGRLDLGGRRFLGFWAVLDHVGRNQAL